MYAYMIYINIHTWTEMCIHCEGKRRVKSQKVPAFFILFLFLPPLAVWLSLSLSLPTSAAAVDCCTALQKIPFPNTRTLNLQQRPYHLQANKNTFSLYLLGRFVPKLLDESEHQRIFFAGDYLASG